MTVPSRNAQSGAVLLIALIMLLVLTLLAVGSMRGVTLESRITANRAHDMQLSNIADSALREAEFRFYGPNSPDNLADKLEPKAENCKPENKLKGNGLNKPCLLAIKDAALFAFVKNPGGLKSENLDIESDIWMPYWGTDHENKTKVDDERYEVGWNSILAAEATSAAINAEYGWAAEGRGTYFYLNNGQVEVKTSDETLYLQSTNANIYLGLNN
ncbi:pilus assembly PilX family protein [Stutzerimonas nitrititolerans]|uniref:pilus assembly PilX family protein n=1 Tax=Stutzerimonas nitrititolerans TaxID=2482751 RepID=UPI0005B4C395|nr:PilX N-terminal domain-containing pilus assembly protein [Stutzerimonas nitrititolerans]